MHTRGVVIYPTDLTLDSWPLRASRAGLNTIALHDGSSPARVASFLQTEQGHIFLKRCHDLGLHVEYELHAMLELLPRGLFVSNPELFRMNNKGERVADANLCVSNARAIEIVTENAVSLCHKLRPTTGRYFLWGDDGAGWCRCPGCRELNDADQSLTVTNNILRAIREIDSRATIAHLSYLNTLIPPSAVVPETGVFLEFAPIRRRYDVPYTTQKADCPDPLEALDANLAWFGKKGSQALEYWLDVSRFSGWKRLSTRIPWDIKVFEADVRAYHDAGVENITTFGAHIDADYVAKFGEPPITEYGAGLKRNGYDGPIHHQQ